MQSKYGALYNLWEAFLHMRAWGLPDYVGLDERARAQFAELVRTRALFTYVEDCKRDLLRNGVEAPDHWLAVLCASGVAENAPLPPADGDRLGAILGEMYPMLVRLDLDAHPGASPIGDQPPTKADRPQPLADAIKRAGASLEWVRRVRDDLVPPAGSIERYTREQWEHIREHDSEIYKPDRNGRSTVPNYDTWSRYVRQFLKIMDGAVNHPRRGRTGRSLARPEEL